MSRAERVAREVASAFGEDLLVEVDPPGKKYTLIGLYGPRQDLPLIVTVPHDGSRPYEVSGRGAPIPASDDNELTAAIRRMTAPEPQTRQGRSRHFFRR